MALSTADGRRTRDTLMHAQEAAADAALRVDAARVVLGIAMERLSQARLATERARDRIAELRVVHEQLLAVGLGCRAADSMPEPAKSRAQQQ
ncbi:hypothetical protein [Nocardia crassostreae]|uniref:hypothetical protein n=1 Tax=Nocardia crassostreae TaxID=53428 RepID=UPI000AD889C4|nr:hypothetical protein [Nocardia crassostreae]